MRKENNKSGAASTDCDANVKSGGDASPTAPTEEEAEEISANEQQKEQRKSLDALYAAAREEFDLDMSPLDSAMKTLREGREIQKLSVLRNLVELVEGEPDEALHRLLPMMQGLLSVTPSNLDIHCEAAIAYKNCIKEKKLQQKCPELSDRFLVAILENIEAQKENVTATAWLESLVDIADCVSMQSIVNMVVPLAVAQADSGKRVQRRVISTRLIEKLALLVPKEILQRELSPCAQMLCQDPSAAVRTSIAQKLSMLAQSLNNSTDCCTLLLPCIIQLCKDEDPSVREAILSSMAQCLPHFSKDAKKSVLLPLLRKCTEQALILRDASLPIVSRHFGSWLHCLRDILTAAELRWWLDTYVRILDFACQHNASNNAIQQQATAQKQVSVENGTPPAVAGNAQQQKQQQLCVACRRMCAYNFPCFVAVFGEETDVFSGRLLPILEQFCRDSDDEVRSIIASGFHEIVAQRKIAPMRSKNTKNSSSISASVPLLLGPFVDLLSSGNADIVQQLTANLHRILPMLYAEISASGTKKRTHLIFAKLDRILVNCNNLMKGSGSWRAHEAYLNGIAVLRNLVSTKDLLSNFVPLLKQEVLTARALPCRIAAAQTLLLMMREFSTSRARQTIVDFFVHEIGHHSNCYRRRLLLDIVPLLLQYFSREFFIDKFLPAVLKLSADPISNIRLQLCRTLPKIKQYLMFPNNDESLSNLERVVRELLASEQNALSRQLIQQFACELSRTEMDKKECRANRAKLAEEKRLWTEHEESTEEIEAETGQQYSTEHTVTGSDAIGSPESGIFFEEDCWLGTGIGNSTRPNNHQQMGGRLCRSATTTSIPQHMETEAHSNLVTAPSASSEMLSAMAIEPFAASSPKAARRRPPPPPPKSWRTTTTIKSANGPKLAIVRPQPQVKVVNQRSSSPMPFVEAEQQRKMSINKLANETPSAATSKAKANNDLISDQKQHQSDTDRQYSTTTAPGEGGKATAESTRKSKLPLSTNGGRHRSSSSAPPVPPPKPKLPLFTSSSGNSPPSPYTTTDSGTSSVTDSIKLKKYRPRDISTTTTMTTRKCSLSSASTSALSSTTNGGPLSTTASSSSTVSAASSRASASSMRSASAVPSAVSGGGATRAITSRSRSPAPAAASAHRSKTVVDRSASPTAMPLQTSASVTSMPRNSTPTRNSTSARRPYGLMRVQSSSNAVERKPAQMSIKVISLT
ncbi:hypothetical protein niasHT_031609 [Heterodera trifolii]|uniref:Serine/threonine-protein phosphatase 4 regulatory subunit 4 n=1 Tax=Heterodera trifolii TaxID=157864 RepID=A0ABD2IXS9_9BILA